MKYDLRPPSQSSVTLRRNVGKKHESVSKLEPTVGESEGDKESLAGTPGSPVPGHSSLGSHNSDSDISVPPRPPKPSGSPPPLLPPRSEQSSPHGSPSFQYATMPASMRSTKPKPPAPPPGEGPLVPSLPPRLPQSVKHSKPPALPPSPLSKEPVFERDGSNSSSETPPPLPPPLAVPADLTSSISNSSSQDLPVPSATVPPPLPPHPGQGGSPPPLPPHPTQRQPKPNSFVKQNSLAGDSPSARPPLPPRASHSAGHTPATPPPIVSRHTPTEQFPPLPPKPSR